MFTVFILGRTWHNQLGQLLQLLQWHSLSVSCNTTTYPVRGSSVEGQYAYSATRSALEVLALSFNAWTATISLFSMNYQQVVKFGTRISSI